MATRTSPYPTLPAASPAVLWREYHRTGDVRLRDRLVFTLAPLIRHAGVDGDGVSAPEAAERGLAALVRAIDAYRPERDGRIERFAWLRVDAALRRRP